jgi:D-alanine-D-alanine ligase
MLQTRVAVVRGGPSSEYEISMTTGAGVLSALRELGYHTTDIIVTKSGDWMIEGRVKQPEHALLTTDVAFIAMHGAYGEDGTIQRIFERHHIPFTGSNSFPSSIAFNKDATKRALHGKDIQLAKHVKIRKNEHADTLALAQVIAKSFGPDYVLKPTQSGSSHGVMMVTGTENLAQALKDIFTVYDECMVEERIRGTEATVAVLENFRNEPLYTLPVVEIVPPPTHDFFSSDVKYTGETLEICPGRFTFEEKRKLGEAAALVHATLGLSQYSRSDFMVRDGEIFFLEVNTLPGLTPQSLFPKAADAVGLSFSSLVDHLVKTARVR